jgi:hypothetical protein
MAIASTIPEPPDPAVVEATSILEALEDRAELHSNIVYGLNAALAALHSPAGNRRANWRTIAAAVAALRELGGPPFASAYEIRAAVCSASFVFIGALGDLIGCDTAPIGAGFRSEGSTVH